MPRVKNELPKSVAPKVDEPIHYGARYWVETFYRDKAGDLRWVLCSGLTEYDVLQQAKRAALEINGALISGRA
jgi:hypothetical protein